MNSRFTVRFFPLVLLVAWGSLYGQSEPCEKCKESKRLAAKVLATSSEWLDINELEARVLNNGSFGQTATGGDGGLYYPKGQTNNSLMYSSGFRLMGKMDGELRTAAVQHVTEFQPGVILPDGTAGDPTDPQYRVYKYNKGDAIDPAAINMGCPTEVLGDQMLWTVFNDLGPEHESVFELPPIGIEVQQTVWAFDRPGVLEKALFIRYRMINKNPEGKTLDSAYVGMWYDPDLGDSNDDACGCDPGLNIAYVYNADNNDVGHYGAGAPAMACDMLEAPAGISPPMTTFFFHLCSNQLTGVADPTKDPQGAQEAYHFIKGFRGNGLPWPDPTTGQDTRYPLSGDPVTGTGWILTQWGHPCDVRLGQGSGPFTLAPGDTQDLVLSIVVGHAAELGGDHLMSVALMKWNDAQVQQVYDDGFALPDSIPTPSVQAGELDKQIVLTWDDAASSYESQGYQFEGYNVWMAHKNSDWTRIATFDVVNHVYQIWDNRLDPNRSALVQVPIQFGSDSGIQYHFEVDQNYVTGDSSLVNGQTYAFAVTAYAYKASGVPSTLESRIIPLEAAPHQPVLDELLNVDLGEHIDATPNTITDGLCQVEVVDPTRVTGHNYSISFTNADAGLLWKMTDTTTGEDVLTDQLLYHDDASVIVDGLWVKVSGVEKGVKSVLEIAYASTMIPDGDNVWHDKNSNGTYYVNTNDNGALSRMERWISKATPDDFQMVFNDEQNWAVFGWDGDVIASVPFAIYRKVFGTGEMKRMVPVLLTEDGDPQPVPPTNRGTDVYGFPCSDGIFWCDATEGGYDQFAAICAAEGVGGIYPYGADGSENSYYMLEPWIVYPIGRFVISDVALNGAWPPAGTTIEIQTYKPLTSDVVFTFTTDGLQPVKATETAKARLDEINVFPNPYLGSVSYDGVVYSDFITFNNLPAEDCTLRIFSLSGSHVKTLVHDNGTPFERWDVCNVSGRTVANGMYIVHVETTFGDRILKLAVTRQDVRFE